MGATVSARANLEKNKKLDFSPRTIELLDDLIQFVETFAQQYPHEAKVKFDRQFQWRTTLREGNFRQLLDAASLFEFRGESVTSKDQVEGGEPALALSQLVSVCDIRCWNFDALVLALKVAKASDTVRDEAKACIEENNDPATNILGVGFVTMGQGSALLATHERLQRERARSTTDHTGEVDQLDDKFRLALLLNSLDIQLLQSSVQTLGRQVRISPEVVDRELELLRLYTGEGRSVSCLAAAYYTQQYAFENGCRAPPWQQVRGDVCYVTIKPFDSPEFIIVGNVRGFFSIPGGSSCGDHDSREQSLTFHPTMVDVIKEKSPHFVTNIGNEEFSKGYQRKILDTLQQDSDKQGTDRLLEASQLRQRNTKFEAQDPTKTVPVESEGSSALTSPLSPRSGGGKREKRTDRPSIPSPIPETTVAKATTGRQKSQSERKGVSPERPPAPQKRSPTGDTSLTGPDGVPPIKVIVPSGHRIYGEDGFETLHRNLMGGRTSRGSLILNRSQSQTALEESMTPDRASGESSSDEEEEEDTAEKRQQDLSEMPADYWNMQKMLKVLKGGNRNATVIALCSMRDFPLSSEPCQMAVRELGGLSVLLNLLSTGDKECMIGSLRVLKNIASTRTMRQLIVDLKGLPLMVKILQSKDRNLAGLAAEAISHVAQFPRARRIVRHYGGISQLVSLLDETDENVCKAGAVGLWSCSISTKNKSAILYAEAISKLAKHLKSTHDPLLIPVVGILQECAAQRRFRTLIRSEGMIPNIVCHLGSTNKDLQRLSCNAIFRCAEDAEVQRLVRECSGVEPLAAVIQQANNVELLTAVTGAVWKCSVDLENAVLFRKAKATEQMVALLVNHPETVLINVAGAVAQFAEDPDCRTIIRKGGGLQPLVQMLTGTNVSLLINATLAVGRLANDNECAVAIDKMDGIRFLWSLLKSSNDVVKAHSLLALCPLMEKIKEAAGMIRSFVGGLELVINLLKSDNIDVLSAVCKLITRIGRDEENLAVMTDHGVVPLLANLANSEQDQLRFHLAEAIAKCCNWDKNRISFGEHHAVAPLVKFLESSDEQVQRATSVALYQLSRDAQNCIVMHKKNVVQSLVKLIASADGALQDHAASCVRNIRLLALANERADALEAQKTRGKGRRRFPESDKPMPGVLELEIL